MTVGDAPQGDFGTVGEITGPVRTGAQLSG